MERMVGCRERRKPEGPCAKWTVSLSDSRIPSYKSDMDGVVELNCAGCILVPAKKIPCVGNKKKKSQQEGDRTELIVCCKHSNPLLVNARDLRHVSERMFSMPCAAVHHLSQSIFFIYYFIME